MSFIPLPSSSRLIPARFTSSDSAVISGGWQRFISSWFLSHHKGTGQREGHRESTAYSEGVGQLKCFICEFFL
jgi:hypothetical protein